MNCWQFANDNIGSVFLLALVVAFAVIGVAGDVRAVLIERERVRSQARRPPAPPDAD